MVEAAISAPPRERRGVVGLDLLRFAAAMYVVVYHLGHKPWATPPGESSIGRLIPDAPAYPNLEPFVWLGWVGVEVFFVISGFVIANSAERASPFAFLRSRILRLMPGIWICATITLGAVLLIQGLDERTFKLYARTMALPLFLEAPWIDSVYWTLVVEFVFYAAVFMVLALDGFRRISGLAMALGVASSALWIAHALGLIDGFVSSWTAHLSLLRHGCFFAAGILLWLILCKRATPMRLAVLCLCLLAGLLEVGQLAQHKSEVIGRELSQVAAQSVFLAGFCAIVLSVACNRQLKALLGHTAGLAPVLGLMTYPLYLVHNVVGVGLLEALDDIGAPRHLALAAATVSMSLLSWLVCRAAEPFVAACLRRPLGWLGAAGQRMPSLAFLFRTTTAVPGRA